MDIAGIKPIERTIDILHPKTGEVTGISVSLVSYDDPRMKSVKRNIRDRRAYQEARGKTVKSEELENQRVQLLFAAMTGWTWREEVRDEVGKVILDAVTFKGRVPKFNKDDVSEVFNELEWFMDQIDEAVADEKAFF